MTTEAQLDLHNHKKHNDQVEKPSKVQRLSSELHFDINYKSQDTCQTSDVSEHFDLQKIDVLGSPSFDNFKGL